MIRWYRRPRPRATAPVLLVRTVGALTVIGLYAALRLPHLVSPWEAAATWVGAAFCLWMALTAAEQLAVRHRDRLDPREPSVLELTDQFEVALGWPGAVENAIATARHEAMQPLIANGEVVEPRLFTHDFDALHHTPPRGFRIPAVPALTPERAAELHAAFLARVGQPARVIDETREAKRELFRQLYTPPKSDEVREPAADLIRRLRAERPSPTGRVVVSHTAPVEITRDRFGQFFGGY